MAKMMIVEKFKALSHRYEAECYEELGPDGFLYIEAVPSSAGSASLTIAVYESEIDILMEEGLRLEVELDKEASQQIEDVLNICEVIMRDGYQVSISRSPDGTAISSNTEIFASGRVWELTTKTIAKSNVSLEVKVVGPFN